MSGPCDNAWELFKQNKSTTIKNINKCIPSLEEVKSVCSDLYISTTTVILYLDRPINLLKVFPHIPILSFHKQKEGVIKKLMKYNFTSEEEANAVIQSFKNEPYYLIDLLKKKHKPVKITYKISVGLCNKDIYLYKKKKKRSIL